MIKIFAGIVLLMMLWKPMEPARHVTGEVLHTVANMVQR